jgi:hypothetical protein
MLRLWIPGAMLLAVLAAVNLPATGNQPGDEVSWLSKLASEGDGGAQLQVGLAYREGRYGLKPDPVKGLHWIRQAAENGNAYAEYMLGSMYAEGQGTKKDMAQATTWWKKAMQDGNTEAREKLIEYLINSGQTQQAEKLMQE